MDINLKSAITKLKKNWYGLVTAYGIIFLLTYGVIWFFMEPLGLLDNIEIDPIRRTAYYILFTLLIASHFTLLIDLHQRWENRKVYKIAELENQKEINDILNSLTFPGVILYGKIRGYARLDPNIKKQILEVIEKEIIQKYIEFHHTVKLIFFSGGSLAIFFEQGKDEATPTALKAFLFGIYLQLVAHLHSFKMGITLDWEGEAKVKLANRQKYLHSKTMSFAKLYMSFSDKEHFFLSNDIVEKYLWSSLGMIEHQSQKLDHDKFYSVSPAPNNIIAFLKSNFQFQNDLVKVLFENLNNIYYNFPNKISDSQEDKTIFRVEKFKYFDRLKKPFELYNFFAADHYINIGKNYIPYHWTFLEQRDGRIFTPDTPKQQKFISRLVEAEEVTIIGITHEQTKRFLAKALEERINRSKRFWRSLQIIFPSKRIIETIIDEREDAAERVDKWEGAQRDLLLFLIEKTKMIKKDPPFWQLHEYNRNLPFIGNRLIGETGVIRIAPILPGKSTKDVYYTEVLNGTMAFAQLSEAFDRICDSSLPLTERIVFGQLIGEENLRVVNILRRTKLDRFQEEHANHGYCFPIVLVVLHTMNNGIKYSTLQKRTEFNASGNTGTYSNISGRVTDIDMLKEKSNELAQLYIEKIAFLYKEKKRDELVETGICRTFEDLMNFDDNKLMKEETWVQTATREIKEELGLSIERERLIPCRYVTHPIDKPSMLFRIFSLELTSEEIERIKDLRPDSELSLYSFDDLKELRDEGKLNALLQKRFEDVFIPLFQFLGI